MKISKKLAQLICTIGAIFLLGSCNQNGSDIATSKEREYSNFQTDSTAILQVLSTQEIAWNNSNIEQFMEGYWKDEKLTFIGSRGITYGWQQTLENYLKGYPDKEAMGQLTFEVISLKPLGNQSAQVIGRYTLKRKEDQPTGYFTLIFQKIEGKWKITSDMTVNSPVETK